MPRRKSTDDEPIDRAALRQRVWRTNDPLAQEERERCLRDEHRRHAELYEQYERDGLIRTREEMLNGATCPGCGQPSFTQGSDAKTPEEQQSIRDEFTRGPHGDHSILGSVAYANSRYLHCHVCCPRIPMDETQAIRISALLNLDRPLTDLDLYRLTLRCGHTIEKTANYDYRRRNIQDSIGFLRHAHECSECEDFRAAVGYEFVRPMAEPASTVPPRKPSKASIAKAKREVREAQKRLDALLAQQTETG